MFHVEQNLVFLFKLSTINILNIIYIGRVPGCRLCGTAPEVPPENARALPTSSLWIGVDQYGEADTAVT
jgi:hypothetical protein